MFFSFLVRKTVWFLPEKHGSSADIQAWKTLFNRHQKQCFSQSFLRKKLFFRIIGHLACHTRMGLCWLLINWSRFRSQFCWCGSCVFQYLRDLFTWAIISRFHRKQTKARLQILIRIHNIGIRRDDESVAKERTEEWKSTELGPTQPPQKDQNSHQDAYLFSRSPKCAAARWRSPFAAFPPDVGSHQNKHESLQANLTAVSELKW